MATTPVGLFFGSFNPIHIGHLALANYFLEFAGLKQIWFVVSPHNPFKEKNTLLQDYHRLELVNRSIGDYTRFKASNIEFKMPQPNYTIHTLTLLSEKYPQHDFSLIMGSDNLESFHKWKNYEVILEHYQVLVYPRPGHPGGTLMDHPSVTLIQAPVIEVSSSFIRAAVRDGKDVRFFMQEAGYNYLKEMHFYE